MRWIVASLVVINVLVLGWQLFIQGPYEPGVNAGPGKALNGTSVTLLTEVDDFNLRSREEPPPLERPAGQESLCTLVGPFPKLLRGEYFVERLAALDVAASVVELETPGEVSYWVHLPPKDSQREAFSQLRELQAKGIDSYVIPRGQLKNGISFGVYSQKSLADAQLKTMQEQGYRAEIYTYSRAYREIWVVLEKDQAGQVSDDVWPGLLASEEGLARRQNYCSESVSSAKTQAFAQPD